MIAHIQTQSRERVRVASRRRVRWPSAYSRATARIARISLIEDEDPASADLVRGDLRRHRPRLSDRRDRSARRRQEHAGRSADDRASHGRIDRSACIAVDPTSPFSGGAVLGDRLRMQTHAADDGVFIRSMATRGHLGGLARATGDAALVLDAAGKDIVIIETVGVGQDEVDIIRHGRRRRS